MGENLSTIRLQWAGNGTNSSEVKPVKLYDLEPAGSRRTQIPSMRFRFDVSISVLSRKKLRQVEIKALSEVKDALAFQMFSVNHFCMNYSEFTISRTNNFLSDI